MDSPVKQNQANLDFVQKRIGIKFRNPELLLSALTHRSWCNEHRGEGIEHNQRLEFLGDGVLSFAMASYTYKAFRSASDDRLTQIKSVLGQTLLLGEVSREIGLETYLRVSHGEASQFSREPNSIGARRILGDAFEALLGAIYLDRGIGVAELFVHQFLFPKLKTMLEKELRHPKLLFQIVAQEQEKSTPTYKLLSESGLARERRYVIGAYLGEVRVAFGEGFSKSEAEARAATQALAERYNITNILEAF